MRRDFFAIFLRFAPCVFWGLLDSLALHLWQFDWVIHFRFARLYPIIVFTSVASEQPSRTCGILQTSGSEPSLAGCACGEL